MALSCRNSDPSRMDQCVNESLQQWERGWGGTKEAVPICGWGGTEEAVSILCQKRKTLQTWVLNNGRNPHLLPRGQRRAFWITGCAQMCGVTEFCGRFEILYSFGHMDLYISGQGQGG